MRDQLLMVEHSTTTRSTPRRQVRRHPGAQPQPQTFKTKDGWIGFLPIPTPVGPVLRAAGFGDAIARTRGSRLFHEHEAHQRLYGLVEQAALTKTPRSAGRLKPLSIPW